MHGACNTLASNVWWYIYIICESILRVISVKIHQTCYLKQSCYLTDLEFRSIILKQSSNLYTTQMLIVSLMYMLCTSWDFVQVSTCTNTLYKLQLVQALYLSVKQSILMNLYFKIHNINISNLYEWQIHCKLYFFNEKANFWPVHFHIFLTIMKLLKHIFIYF